MKFKSLTKSNIKNKPACSIDNSVSPSGDVTLVANINNVSIDSAYITNSSNNTLELKVVLKNSGEKITNLPVSLFKMRYVANDNQRSTIQ